VTIAALVSADAADAQTKMTITAGVDPSFAAFYVAKEGGIFQKNGLDVSLRTGPSGSSLVPLLIGGESQAAQGAEGAGVSNFNVSNGKVVFVGETAYLGKFYALVGRQDIKSIDELKGKKIGVSVGTGGELFWVALSNKLNLKAEDYKRVQVDAPEMVAAFERGDIDAFSVWEPWITRSSKALGSKMRIIQDGQGIYGTRSMTYMNRDWVEKNPEATRAFIKSLKEAMDVVTANPSAAAKLVASTLKMEQDLVQSLFEKLDWRFHIDQATIDAFALAEQQLEQSKKLTKPLDYKSFIVDSYLKEIVPGNVSYKTPR
jgi:NitT/TauT family transport system substrate-binding protein